MQITTIGLDIAKNVFQVHGIDAAEKVRAGLRESEQDDKWSFCLTTGTLCPANQERQ